MSDIDSLLEDVEGDPLWQAAGLLANAPSPPAKGYVTVPLAWLARVLPVVRTPTHLVVAMLIYRESLVWRSNTVPLSNGVGETRHQPLRQISSLGLAARGRGDRDRGGKYPALSAGDFALVLGGQVGCNLQFGGNWVVGIEGEGSAADIRGDLTRTILGITGTGSAKTNWIASATGRLGWAWDRWLIYGKGGAAWAHDEYSLVIPVFLEQETANQTRTGWTVGGGVEWAVWNNWSVKAEYDYYDFGTSSVTLVGTFAGAPIAVPGVEIRQRISVGKLGVNYRF